MIIYLAGPMTGIKDNNFHAFHEVTKFLRDSGFTVFNPAELPCYDPQAHDRSFYIRLDIQHLLMADILVYLPRSELSKGALLEIEIAKQIGIDRKPLHSFLIRCGNSIDLVDKFFQETGLSFKETEL